MASWESLELKLPAATGFSLESFMRLSVLEDFSRAYHNHSEELDNYVTLRTFPISILASPEKEFSDRDQVAPPGVSFLTSKRGG